MVVHLNDIYRVEIDEMNHILWEKRTVTKRDGGEKQEKEIVAGYFSSMASVLKFIVRRKLYQSKDECENMEEYITKLQEVVKQVESITL